MAEGVVPFPGQWHGSHVAAQEAHRGNGARDALQRILGDKGGASGEAIDIFLMCLWADGYKVVPLDPLDKVEGGAQ